VHQIRFRPGRRPDPTEGAYSTSPGPLAALRGATSKAKRGEGEGEGRGEEERKGKERERKGLPSYANLGKNN